MMRNNNLAFYLLIWILTIFVIELKTKFIIVI